MIISFKNCLSKVSKILSLENFFSFSKRFDLLLLIKKLNHYAYCYYVLDKPEVSDVYYNQLYKQLKNYEADNPLLVDAASPTQRVGDAPLDSFEQFGAAGFARLGVSPLLS